MLDPFRETPGFAEHYDRVCALLGRDPIALARTDPEVLKSNAVSSLLTVLASVLALTRIRQLDPAFSPIAVGGYSVGQWSALHAADALHSEVLFAVVAARARLMDECVAAAPPTGMLAVIGVRGGDLVSLCEEAAALGEILEITNWNAPGQSTLGGTDSSLHWAIERLRPLRPKSVRRVPVAGAWHSRFLIPAVDPLARLLDDIELRPTRVPVVDNTTGGWLPDEGGERRAALARHLAAPVYWERGVRTMIAHGALNLLEVGYGDLLSKFGFFIDRTVSHRPMAAPARPPR